MTVNVTNTVGANNTIVLDGSSKIPAFDGSLVTALSASAFTTGSLATARIDVGTTAGKVLQLDGSARIPALSGANLTNVPGPTVSTSDPTISTNPTLGKKWVNKTSGEVYICTDATAGENVWTNVGAGSGDITPFPSGLTHGFFAGGTGTINVIDKFAFASNTTAADHGDLYLAKINGCGSSSTTYGYSAGSSTPSSGNGIDKFAFATNTTGTDVGNLTQGNKYMAGNQMTTTAVYWSGGLPSARTTVIEKCLTASDGNATDGGDLSRAIYSCSGCCSTTHSYTAGGEAAPPNSFAQTGVDKYTFASAGTAADHGDLVTYSRTGQTVMSTTHGYTMGGTSDVNYHNTIQKFAFSSNTTATDVADLVISGHAGGGNAGSATQVGYGYYCGGNGIPYSSKLSGIEKFNLTTEANTTDHGSLQAAKADSDGGYQV